MLEAIRWLPNEECLELLDQTRLPTETTYIKCCEYRDIVSAIKRLAVRGAPAIRRCRGLWACDGSQENKRKVKRRIFIPAARRST